MTTVQHELPRISDLAARQTIDSTAVYKEFLRVHETLLRYEGSMHWKKTLHYEYLTHKVHGRTTSHGARSTETEAIYFEFIETKQKLTERYKTLKATVETSQRMNKAVRAGSVPQAVVDVLATFDDAGLSKEALVVGSPALYAYSQRSGLCVDAVLTPGDKKSVVDSEHPHFIVLFEMKAVRPDFVEKLRSTLKGTEIKSEKFPHEQKVALHFSYGKSEHVKNEHCISAHFIGSKCSTSSHYSRPTVAEADNLACWGRNGLLEVLDEAPKFEQVVIGKTGRMAMMRTVDPGLFVALCKSEVEAGATTSKGDAQRTQSQVELVSRMLEDYLVTSKLEEDELNEFSERLSHYLTLASGEARDGCVSSNEFGSHGLLSRKTHKR
jgi:hypothetical protein